MDSLKTMLFEDPLWLYVILAFAEAILLLAWRHWRSPRLAWALLAPLVLAITTGVLAWKVTTDRELVTQRLGQLAFALERGQHATIVKLLDVEYQDRKYNYDLALREAARVMESYKIERVKLSGLAVDVEGDRATSSFSASVRASTPWGKFDSPSSWTLWWVRRTEGWRVISARMDGGAPWADAPAGP